MTASTEVEPAAAAEIFGEHIELAREFTANLAREGEPRGLIGPLELPRLWTRHILNCAFVLPLIKPGSVADIGSGAGLPGMVLAIGRPETHFTLVEPMERRVDWLSEQLASLGLTNVTVLRSRAEDAKGAAPFDQITARAVSAFRKLIPLTAPLVRPGGELVLMKGTGASAEINSASREIQRFGLRDIEVIVLGEGVVAETTRVIRATVK